MNTFTLVVMITLAGPTMKTTYTPYTSEIDCRTHAQEIRLAATLDPHRSVANIYAQCFRNP
jgi:hypothetical protein